MKKRFNRTRAMYQVVINILESFLALWTNYLPLATAVTAFKDKVALIDLNLQEQAAILTGYTINKKTKRKLMSNLAAIMAKKVRAYAFASGDQILYGKMNISFSKLFFSKDNNGVVLANIIYDAAFAMPAADKTAYEITADDLDDLSKAIEAVVTLPSPEQMRAVRKQITALLPQLFKDATGILKGSIDNLVNDYKLTDEEFFAQYFNARRTYESHRHTTVQGETTDLTTGEDLSNVQVFIKSDTTEFEELTDVQGKFKKQIEPEVNYTLKFVLPQYEVVEFADVNLDRGKHKKFDVKLKKINP